MSHPFPRLQELVVEPGLGGAGLGPPIITPGGQRRHRHQDGLRAALRLQPEQGAAVVDQVELHVAPAPVELEIALALAVSRIAAAFDDGGVGGHETASHVAREVETALEAPFVEVVEEQAADAALLAAVREVEVVVAPALEARIDVLAVDGAEIADAAMPVARVRLEAVVGRQVEAAAEPPDRGLARFLRDEEADIAVGGGDVGIARMDHHRDAGREEIASRQLGATRGGGRRQRLAGDT
ncbi:ferric pseudobactins receptor protein RF5-like protein [Salinisphaera sp. PC39]